MKNLTRFKLNYQEIIFIVYVLYFTIMYIVPPISNILEHYSMIINFVVTISLFILNIKQISTKQILLVIIVILNLIIGMLINNTGFGSLITLINIYLLFLYGDKTQIRQIGIRVVCCIVVIGEFVFSLVDKSIYNPNTIGYLYFIMTIFFYILVAQEKKKNKVINLMTFIITAINIIFIYNSESRASLLGVFVFLIFLLFKIFTENRKIYKTVTFIVIIGTIIFPYIYIGMWNNGIEVDIDNYSNKKFYSGRQVKWSLMVDDFKGKELYGLGSNYRFPGSSNLNVHNSLFAVYMIYGTINFIVFIIMFINFIWKMQRYCLNKTNRIATAGMIGIVIVSYYESNIIWGSMFMYIIALSLIAMKRDEGDKKCVK